ncbi:hypothetical protein P7K49_027362 [Saguinus oedipus]|uniref:Uncharacterized protein n=1 Tax=Saguinus oedipus TaxID=9490 RepID=A0ABQ9U9Z6_SAGOE|nr:hypothetical protein P7K49_027362 [Saguinus oedipus]
MQGIMASLEVAHGVKVMKCKQLLALKRFFGRLETAEEACAKLSTTWQKKDGSPAFDEIPGVSFVEGGPIFTSSEGESPHERWHSGKLWRRKCNWTNGWDLTVEPIQPQEALGAILHVCPSPLHQRDSSAFSTSKLDKKMERMINTQDWGISGAFSLRETGTHSLLRMINTQYWGVNGDFSLRETGTHSPATSGEIGQFLPEEVRQGTGFPKVKASLTVLLPLLMGGRKAWSLFQTNRQAKANRFPSGTTKQCPANEQDEKEEEENIQFPKRGFQTTPGEQRPTHLFATPSKDKRNAFVLRSDTCVLALNSPLPVSPAESHSIKGGQKAGSDGQQVERGILRDLFSSLIPTQTGILLPQEETRACLMGAPAPEGKLSARSPALVSLFPASPVSQVHREHSHPDL